jgi:hypothetical protein
MPLRLPHISRQLRRTASVFLLAGGALLSGCRSQQAAFRFRPDSQAEHSKTPGNRPTPPSGLAASTTPEARQQPVVAYAPAAALTAPQREAKAAAAAVGTLPAPKKVRRPLVRWQGLQPKPAAASRPHSANLHETGHLVLGIALVAAGVVAGLLLGGWLGLGVGAAVVILGYYFLGLAFGGKHAWLEVFQEFFNM